eukprot:COSAG04_NODE_3879_length_2454_cov_1.938004_3_plen_267_part_00
MIAAVARAASEPTRGCASIHSIQPLLVATMKGRRPRESEREETTGVRKVASRLLAEAMTAEWPASTTESPPQSARTSSKPATFEKPPAQVSSAMISRAFQTYARSASEQPASSGATTRSSQPSAADGGGSEAVSDSSSSPWCTAADSARSSSPPSTARARGLALAMSRASSSYSERSRWSGWSGCRSWMTASRATPESERQRRRAGARGFSASVLVVVVGSALPAPELVVCSVAGSALPGSGDGSASGIFRSCSGPCPPQTHRSQP